MVLLGWDLDPRVVEACAEECALHRSDLYLWQPLLTGHGAIRPDPAWQVVALDGRPVARRGHKLEFTFVCPNQAGVRESATRLVSEAVASGYYQGVFLDRIRYPSPAQDPVRQVGCFCDACREVAGRADLDLSRVRNDLLRLLGTQGGREAAVRRMLSTGGFQETAGSQEAEGPLHEGPLHSLDRVLAFRRQSISAFGKEVAETARGLGARVGLDCYSPTLAPMVGQDLKVLAGHSDWIKVMTYARAFAPASLPFEILGLADWLVASGGTTESATMALLAEATGWPLPSSRGAVRTEGLSAPVLTQELRRGRELLRGREPATHARLLAGIELVEIPGVAELSAAQMRADSAAVLADAPDGLVLSWDLWRMPLERLDTVKALYPHPTAR